ncbi:MAG: prolipoprotein diacylglyceryl transferase [Oscillospiraceae bacterium]|jgi:phosphatidylglycerol:prolipoprotein diacylglycerol transferase|nr:prolipoprotein diacylglyceryl transferase [Oscillospiraceae bacterium]
MFGDAGFDLPDSVNVFGAPLYFYGMIIALGLLLAVVYALRVRDRLGLTQDNILDILIFGIPAGIIGARLYYAIFNFDQYFGPGKWLNIFKLREGGLAIYGGIIFGAATVIIYSRVKKVPLGSLLDVLGLGLLIGQSIGRWGNFFNREAYGAVTGLPWRMGLTRPGYDTVYVHPTFLYESLWNALGFALLHFFSKKRKRYSGQVFLLYLVWYGLGRFMIEGLRADSLYIPGTDIRVSQLLSAVLLIAAVAMLVRERVRGRSLAELTLAGAPDAEDAEDDEAEDGEDGDEDVDYVPDGDEAEENETEFIGGTEDGEF